MMSDDERLNPAFRARLRADLVRRARENNGGSRRRSTVRLMIAGTGVLVIGAIAFLGITLWQDMTPVPEPIAAADMIALCVDGAIIAEAGSGREGIEITVPDGHALEERILAACTRLWQEGRLSSGIEFQSSDGGPESLGEGAPSQGLSSSAASSPVPSLTVCTLADSEVLVIPQIACGEAGLASWPDASGG